MATCAHSERTAPVHCASCTASPKPFWPHLGHGAGLGRKRRPPVRLPVRKRDAHEVDQVGRRGGAQRHILRSRLLQGCRQRCRWRVAGVRSVCAHNSRWDLHLTCPGRPVTAPACGSLGMVLCRLSILSFMMEGYNMRKYAPTCRQKVCPGAALIHGDGDMQGVLLGERLRLVDRPARHVQQVLR